MVHNETIESHAPELKLKLLLLTFYFVHNSRNKVRLGFSVIQYQLELSVLCISAQ